MGFEHYSIYIPPFHPQGWKGKPQTAIKNNSIHDNSNKNITAAPIITEEHKNHHKKEQSVPKSLHFYFEKGEEMKHQILLRRKSL